MPEDSRIFELTTTPGFGRDGTVLDNNYFINGQWTRFQRGRPKKIGGYKEISNDITTIIRGSYVFVRDGIVYLYGFGRNTCQLTKTTLAAPTAETRIVILPDLLEDDLYTFQVDAIFDSLGSGTTVILAHGAHNNRDIASSQNLPVFSSTIGVDPPVFNKLQDGNGNDVLVSGGVTVLQPFVFVYGNDGLIKNSNRNDPNDFRMDTGGAANEVNVAATKIVKGLPLRGGGQSPAGLFWSLDSLIKVTYASGSNFRYDIISSQTSIISPSSVIEYDGVYFWIGVDRFLAYDGTVKEIPNKQNLNWFFDHVNFNARTKVWATKVPRFGEIWWFFPYGEATECTHAIILNVRENTWYDLMLPRSAGYYSQVLSHPIMYSNIPRGDIHSVFVHEFGRDAIYASAQHAIPAYFETSNIDFFSGNIVGGQGNHDNVWTYLDRVEPDFLLNGNLTMSVRGSTFAQSPIEEYGEFVITPTTEKIDTRVQLRNMRLRFMSNESEGFFEGGRMILHIRKGDKRS